jgi:hypothetical protein
MPHGYTNHTTRDGFMVINAYQGPDAVGRCALETAVLRALAGRLPVPRVVEASADCLCTAFMVGVHGQELIEAVHHPEHASSLGGLFDAYGSAPAWAARQQALLAHCRAMLRRCERWQPEGDGVRLWRDRLCRTESWTE